MTQDILAGHASPLASFNAPTAAHPPVPSDPDATVVIGRHRADRTRDTRPVPAARTPRGGWRGWVSVSRLWRRRPAGDGR